MTTTGRVSRLLAGASLVTIGLLAPGVVAPPMAAVAATDAPGGPGAAGGPGGPSSPGGSSAPGGPGAAGGDGAGGDEVFADVVGLSDRLEAVAELPAGSDPDDSADELGIAEDGAGSLQVEEGRVAVSIRYATRPSEADFAALAALADVQATSIDFARASAYVAPGSLEAVAALPRVASVVEALQPATSDEGRTPTVAEAAGATGAASTTVASTASVVGAAAAGGCRAVEAVGAAPLRADLAAATRGVDGSGVTVGIISDSYARSTTALSTPDQDVADGLLPGPGNPCGHEQPVAVITDDGTQGVTDEGRGMAQVVHSIAPGAKLAFAAVGIDDMTFHDAILALTAAGATVIVDDIFLFGEPFYHDGPVAWAITEAERQGVTYLTSAGNYNNVGEPGYDSAGYAVNGWQTTAYRPTGCPAAVLDALASRPSATSGPFDCMDFAQGGPADPTDRLGLPATADPVTFALQWSEAWGFAKGAFRLAVTDPAGATSILGETADGLAIDSGGYKPPLDGAYGFSIVRDLSAGAPAAITPALKWIWAFRGTIIASEYYGTVGDDRVGSTIAGHGGSPLAVSVAAAPAEAPGTAEDFSSVGPVSEYFAVDDLVSPVPRPLPAPVTRPKPDVTGVDRILTNFFSSHRPVEGRPGVYAFWGTSAAAPSVAAVVALGRQYSPAATPAELRAALLSTAVPVSSGFPAIADRDATGSGRVDAAAFLAALPAPAVVPVPVPAALPDRQLAATGAEGPGFAAGLVGSALAAMLLGGMVLGLRRRSRADGRSA